jgi:hypothetical protein
LKNPYVCRVAGIDCTPDTFVGATAGHVTVQLFDVTKGAECASKLALDAPDRGSRVELKGSAAANPDAPAPTGLWSSATFSADGRYFVAIADAAHVWKTDTGEHVARTSLEPYRDETTGLPTVNPASFAALSRDGHRLAVAFESAIAVDTLAPLHELGRLHTNGEVRALAFSPTDMTVLAVGTDRGVIQIFRGYQAVVTRAVSDASIDNIAFDDAGQTLVFTDAEHVLRVADARTAEPRATIVEFEDGSSDPESPSR